MSVQNGNSTTGKGPLLTIALGIAVIIVAAIVFLAVKPATVHAADKKADDANATPMHETTGVSQAPQAKNEELAEYPFDLPNPVFAGTPKDIPPGARMLKPTGKSRDPFKAPKGLTNVALNKKVTSSDPNPIIGSLDLITDGDKEALDGRWVELAPGKQWVQIDLGEEMETFMILLWHLHAEPQIYRDVIIKASNDKDMIKDVTVIFNNDFDNSSGEGKGLDYEYFEDFEGKLFDTKGVKARYFRFYSNGSTSDDQNRYTEIEIWGRKPKK
jgi:hypothetical protein